MINVKSMLCPVDFSEPSRKAVEVARDLAEHFSAELVLLHVVPLVPTPHPGEAPLDFDVVAYRKILFDAGRTRLEELRTDVIGEKIPVRTRLTEGDPASDIVEVAREEDVDAIVTATHGETGWRRLVFGSVAEKVVRTADRPVLIIHGPKE